MKIATKHPLNKHWLDNGILYRITILQDLSTDPAQTYMPQQAIIFPRIKGFMKIRTKLITILLLLTAMIIIAIIAELIGSSKNEQQISASKTRYLSFVLADEFRHSSMNLTRLARSYAATGEQTYSEQYWNIVKWRSGQSARPANVNAALYPGQVKKQSDIMRELNFSQTEFDLLAQASQLSNDLIKTEEQAMNSMKQGRIVMGPFSALTNETTQQFALRILFDRNYENDIAKIMQPLDAFFTSIDRRTAKTLENANTQANFWLELALIVQIFVCICVVLIIMFSIKYVFTPLDKVVAAMQEIGHGEGDLSARLNDKGTDELADLARGFNQFSANIQVLVNQVSDSVLELSTTASQLTVTAKDTNNSVTEQQQALDSISAAISEMASTVQVVANNANSAASAASEADNQAINGQHVVSQAITSIDVLSREIQSAVDAIAKVEQDSNTITAVLDVIRGIADQTNLLALNAAIEAARAGEQGRGFAVVADEVRTLAQRTQTSTEEIQQMIESLQRNANSAVTVMNISRDHAAICVKHATTAGQSLNSITESVSAINGMNTQIATAGEQQSIVSEEINQSVHDILGKVQQTSTGAQETAENSADLTRVSEQLTTLLGRFRT